MRGALLVGVSLLDACLFPPLGGLSGGDSGIADAGADASADASVEAADDAGSDAFAAGIGCAAATPDLLAYYTLDEGTGSVVSDCVSPKNVGNVLFAAHTAWVSGAHGKALEIDPSSGVCVAIDFATPAFAFGGSPATPFTVAMWINVITLPVASELGYIAGQSSNITAAGWRFSVAPGGTIQLAVPNGSGGTTNVTGPSIGTGAWHHIAAVYAGASSAVYLDGKAGAPTALPSGFMTDVATDHMRIGCSSDDQHQLHAQVDDVRFYNRALGAAEIVIVKDAQ